MVRSPPEHSRATIPAPHRGQARSGALPSAASRRGAGPGLLSGKEVSRSGRRKSPRARVEREPSRIPVGRGESSPPRGASRGWRAGAGLSGLCSRVWLGRRSRGGGPVKEGAGARSGTEGAAPPSARVPAGRTGQESPGPTTGGAGGSEGRASSSRRGGVSTLPSPMRGRAWGAGTARMTGTGGTASKPSSRCGAPCRTRSTQSAGGPGRFDRTSRNQCSGGPPAPSWEDDGTETVAPAASRGEREPSTGNSTEASGSFRTDSAQPFTHRATARTREFSRLPLAILIHPG